MIITMPRLSREVVADVISRRVNFGITLKEAFTLSTIMQEISASDLAERAAHVFIVDDDQLVLHAVKDALEAGGLSPQPFSSAAELLACVSPDDLGCVETDLQMPEMNGLDLQKALIEKDSSLSLIMLTAYADVPLTVKVMKRGAVTLLEKPFKVDRLTEEVHRAIEHSKRFHVEKKRIRESREAISRLTAEELAVLDCAAKGKPNKAISYELSLSSRTVDRRRQSALRKLAVDSVSEFAVIRAAAEDKQGILERNAE